MTELNIAKTIVKLRNAKGINQGDLASFLGVTKASVSKWESGKSYPDILMLPQLATYFGITIDELMSYQPQMTKSDISKLYLQLEQEFKENDFDETFAKWQHVVHEYHTCYPLLLQMGLLLLNAVYATEKWDLLGVCQQLFARIYEESADVTLKDWGDYSEALCLMAMEKPLAAVDILKKRVTYSALAHDDLLAMAYLTAEQGEAAQETMQVAIYEKAFALMGSLIGYMMMPIEEEKVLETISRIHRISETLNCQELVPSIFITFNLNAAYRLGEMGRAKEALDFLENAINLMIKDRNCLFTTGDSYFDKIGQWIKLKEDEYGFTNHMNEFSAAALKDLLDVVLDGEMYSNLANESRFKIIKKKAKALGNK